MKGSTHGAIGIAAAETIQKITVHTIASNPMLVLSLLSAYLGALICDIDIGTSTVSNALVFIKSKHLKKVLYAAFIAASIAVLIYYRDTKYFKFASIAVLLTALSFNHISSEIYKIVRKVLLIGTAAAMATAGIIYKQPPLIIAGVVLAALMFSPHRAYSHSLLALVVCCGVVKYTCSFYGFYDVTIPFGIGMASHIAADFFTEKGVMVLFPYTKRIKFPLTMKTGSAVENVICIAALGVAILELVLGKIAL